MSPQQKMRTSVAPVFINYPLETFTPTASGAIATIINQCCTVAAREGIFPTVITRSATVPSFDWPVTHFIDYPEVAERGLAWYWQRWIRKQTGWRHLRQKIYARRVRRTLIDRGFKSSPVILFNDPETAVYLRRTLPDLRIFHWFFNQIEARKPWGAEFGRATQAIAAVSRFTGQHVEREFQLPSETVQTIHIGVDSEHFQPAAETPQKCVINFLGRTGIEKAPDVVLKACLLLAEKRRDFGLQLLGSNHWDRFQIDDYQRSLSSLVERLESKGITVRRPGHVGREKLLSELQQAQIHVLPSRWDEPFALATLEGMACGLATIVSRTGGTPEAVGDAAFYFERDHVEELARHLESLVSDPGLRRAQGIKAREQAMRHTWERTWQQVRGMIDQAGGSHGFSN